MARMGKAFSFSKVLADPGPKQEFDARPPGTPKTKVRYQAALVATLFDNSKTITSPCCCCLSTGVGKPLLMEIKMDRATAEHIDAIMREISGRLNESIKLVMTNSPPEEFKSYRHKIGKIMGEIFLEIQEPLYAEHPELTPPDLRGID